MNKTNNETPPLAGPTGWALLTTPLRIALAILVFAPVSLALKATAKLGELLSEAGADLDWQWTKLAQDTAFLLHGKSLETAKQNAKELKDLRARWKFFHGDDDKPNRKMNEPGSSIPQEGAGVCQQDECKCRLRERLVGDGCDICNPEYAAAEVSKE